MLVYVCLCRYMFVSFRAFSCLFVRVFSVRSCLFVSSRLCLSAFVGVYSCAFVFVRIY